MTKLKIAVIGAGPSGLCAAKHSLDYKYDVTVFEKASQIGGTWVYTDQVGKDEYGLPVHTSMYKGLMTNLPVESMGFPEFKFENKGKSFVSHDEVLEFFQSYAREFNINDVIKFSHNVINVTPIIGERWEVTVRKLRDNSYLVDVYDAVFVCNGHYNNPHVPKFSNFDSFRGQSMHSHYYRVPNVFQGQDVLIVGAGPSGKDMALEIEKFANRITLSHHRDLGGLTFTNNLKQQGDITRFTENGAIFANGDEETFTYVLFCTGYKYSFPFLSMDSQLYLEDSFYIHPLYKHLININYPTLAIVGLQICAYTYMYDLQIRFCLKFWSGEKEMPSKEEMLDDTRREMDKQEAKNISKRHFHLLGTDQTDYFYQLAAAGEVQNVPEVLFKIYDDCNQLRIAHPNIYREFNYRIIDDQTFVRTNPNESITSDTQ